MSIQYNIGPLAWDENLYDAGYTSEASALISNSTAPLIVSGSYVVAGVPAATAGYFAPGALINNLVDGDVYRNSGTVASPVFVAI